MQRCLYAFAVKALLGDDVSISASLLFPRDQVDFQLGDPEATLTEITGYGPDQLTAEALRRYWQRFDAKLQTGIYFAKSNPTFWAARSGTILGRL